MASVRTAAAVFFLLLTLFLSPGMKMMVEGRVCSMKSRTYRGPCGRSHNCASVCMLEGFPDGRCTTFRRRCVCRKPC